LAHMTFAFLVHPRVALRADMARVWRPLGLVPSRVYDHALRRLPLPPMMFAEIRLAGKRVGDLILVPFGAAHLLSDRRQGNHKVVAAVDRAVRSGVDLVGLGGLTAPVTNGGMVLRRRTDIGVTNGNAFTAAIVHRQVRSLLAGAAHGRVAVVGATGSVGSAVSRLLARDGDVAELLLVARGSARLASLAAEVGSKVPVRTSDRLAAVADSDVVVLLTAAAETVLRAEHLGPGAAVLDATQPRNTSPELQQRRPDVLLLDGGVVDVPGLRLHGGSVGLPDGRTFACLAETLLLSLSGHRGHFTLGRPTLEQIDHISGLALRHGDLGFRPAAPSTFGRPATIPHRAPGRTETCGGVEVAAAGSVLS
jgi:fatty aldehyde-generating acyl-ACP reductase